MRSCIVTVGTSLAKNVQNNIAAAGREDDWLFHIRSLGVTTASAETNSLSRLIERGTLAPGDELVFVASATELGGRCAAAVARFFQEEGFITSVRQIEGLTYEEKCFKNKGMHALIAMLVQLIGWQQRRGRQVLINATGGFKAEVAYATTAGLLFGIPVYYLHESFKEIIELPPAPISWDYSLLADYEEFFEWMQGELRPRKETMRRLAGLPEKVRMFIEEEDNLFMLSTTGEAFYAAYLAKLELYSQVTVLLSEKAAGQYQALEQTTREKFDRLLRQIRVPEYRAQMAGQIGERSDCRIYPRGNRSERLFFYDSEGSVHICELTRHSDESYERALERGVRKESYGGFSLYQLS